MTKKLVALFLAVMMMTIYPTAFSAEERRDFRSGAKYSLEIKDRLKINGEEKFEFMLPFYSQSVTITTTAPGGKIDFNIDGETYTISILEKKTEFEFPTPLRMGEKDLVISSKEAVTITKIEFFEIMEEFSVAGTALDTTDYENATSTALILREGTPVYKTKTAIRYYDYNNINVKPVYVDNKLYVPADSLASALEIYFEEDLTKDFFVLRKEEKELIYLDGEFKLGINNEYSSVSVGVQSFWSKTYLPLRQVAELFDYYVLYKDGFIICDYRTRAKTIADKYFSELKTEFDAYMYKGIVGKTYYVSKEKHASDENDGSKSAPFATLKKAADIAQAGDTVIICEGVYQEELIPKNDGTAAHPITFKAKEGDEVILSATETVTGFTEYKNGILVASVPWDMGFGRNQVFYKNNNLVEGRYPNSEVGEDGLVQFSSGLKLDPVWITEGDMQVDLNDNKKVISDTLLQEEEENYWEGAVYVSQHGVAWTLCLGIVESSKKGELTLGEVSDRWWFDADTKNPNKGFLTCHINTLDVPGEWTMNNNYIYIIPPECETAETLEIDVKKRQLICDLNDREYIHIEGIKGFGGSIRMNNSKMCVLNNCDLRYISHYTYGEDQRSLYIEDYNWKNPNGAPQRGEVGIFIGGSDNAVVNSQIRFSAACGLYIVGSYCYVDNNYFTDMCYAGSSYAAIAMETEGFKPMSTKRGGHTITHNTVKRVARQAFVISRSEGAGWSVPNFLPSEVAYNDFSETSICTLDTGTIYMWGSEVGNALSTTKIHHNYVYEIAEKAEHLVGAIYNDNYMRGTETFDNLIFAAMENQYMNDVYEQRKRLFPASFATVDSWNNINLGVKKDSTNALTKNDFPAAKPFKAGSTLAPYDYDMTYDYYKNGIEGVYGSSDMILSEGVSIDENNRVKFSDEGQWVKIENVNLDNYNTVNLVYSADYYKDYDIYDVAVGDDLSNPEFIKDLILYPEAKYNDDLVTVYTFLPENIKGTKTVWVRCGVKGGDSSLFQVHFNNRGGTIDNDTADGSKIYGGACSTTGKGNDPLSEAAPSIQTRNNNPILIGTWGSNWAKYRNIKINANVKTLNVGVGTGGKWAGNKINVRLGSVDGEIIGTVETVESNWAEAVVTAPLNRTLAPGLYDIYLTFEGSGKCSDLYWFGFQ